MIDPSLRARLEPHLEPGEQLLWAAAPDPFQAALPEFEDVLFGSAWYATVLLMFDGWLSPVFTIVLIGLGLLAAPLRNYILARNTLYAITDRRIVKLYEGWRRSVNSYTPQEIGRLRRIEMLDGSGTLAFHHRSPDDHVNQSGPDEIALSGIAEVRTAETLIRTHLLESGWQPPGSEAPAPETPAEAAAYQELETGERLVWAGSPIPGRVGRAAIAGTIIGIIWTAFVLLGMFSLDRSTGGFNLHRTIEIPLVIAVLSHLPYVGVGVWLLLSPLWAEQAARDTVYAISDLRVITIRHGRRLTVESYAKQDLTSIQVIAEDDGSGTLVLAQQTPKQSNHHPRSTLSYRRSWGHTRFSSGLGITFGSSADEDYTVQAAFYNIRNVRLVENLLRDTLGIHGQGMGQNVRGVG